MVVAIARFLRLFPHGFQSSAYFDRERKYKLAAREKLMAAAPLEVALTSTGLGEGILSAFRATNLLAPIESARIQEALRGPRADTFVRGAARIANGDTARGFAEVKEALAPHRAATWPVATYLPFLWQPDTQMFLKPEVTKDFAARVGHEFADDYSPDLNPSVYASLQSLVVTTESAIAELKPVDRIDVQSFIWIVGKYVDE